jgi:hypothetical protein
MFHAKKPDLPFVDSFFEIMKKVVDDRADEIKPKPDDELYMDNGSGCMPDCIVKL